MSEERTGLPPRSAQAIQADQQKREQVRLCEAISSILRIETSPRTPGAQGTGIGLTRIEKIRATPGGLVIEAAEASGPLGKERGVRITVTIPRDALPDIVAVMLGISRSGKASG